MLDTAQPKPRKRASVKRSLQRVAAKIIRQVRARCVLRDGDCRISEWELNTDDWHSDYLPPCDDVIRSEWAHMGDKKRFKTRGQAPAKRHTTMDSLMLCASHHQQYDGKHPSGIRLEITPLTERGADGPLKFASTQTDRPR